MDQEEEVGNQDESLQLVIRQMLDHPDVLEHYKEIRLYLQNNKPSFTTIADSFKCEMADDQNNFTSLSKSIYQILTNSLKANIQRAFIRALFGFIDLHKDQLNINFEELHQMKIQNLWNLIWPADIPEFVRIFHLDNLITQADFVRHFNAIMQKKKYDDAFNFYDAVGLEVKEFNRLIDAMNTNADCTKAADYINKKQYDPDNYPQIQERLEKLSQRYIQNNFPWFKAEELMSGRKQALAYYCEDIYFKGLKKESISIVVRNDLLQYIKKADIKQSIQADLQQNFEVIENILYSKDFFGPSDVIVNPQAVFLQMSDFGLTEESVIFVDKLDEKFTQAVNIILQAPRVGIDSEFLTAQTKLDRAGMQLQILQIATDTLTFIFDLQTLKEVPEFKDFLIQMFENNKICKIGQAFKGDVSELCKHLNIVKLDFRNYLDIASAFKQQTGEQSARNLAFIANHYFNKQLSKFEQQSNWKQRPLRKAILHYAALDAAVCIQIVKQFTNMQPDIMEEEIESFTIQQQG